MSAHLTDRRVLVILLGVLAFASWFIHGCTVHLPDFHYHAGDKRQQQSLGAVDVVGDDESVTVNGVELSESEAALARWLNP